MGLAVSFQITITILLKYSLKGRVAESYSSFHTVHGVLKARIPKWFAIPFSSGQHSVRPLHLDPLVLGDPTLYDLVSLS